MKKDLAIAAVVVVVILIATWALAVAIPDAPMTPSKPHTPAAKGEGKPTGRVVMHVNGEPITETEFNLFIEQAPAEQRPMYASPAGRRMLADELVKVKALEQEANKLGLDDDPEVRAQIAMVASQIKAGKALQKLVGAPDEQALRAQYDKERGNYETVELSHILVAYQGGAAPPKSGQPLDAAQAMIKARAIAQRVKAGADFATVAKAESDDVQSANMGGRLGPVPVAALPPELQTTVANLESGQTSDAVRSQFGIHVFRAGQRSSRPFEELREELGNAIKRTNLEKTMDRIQRESKVELDPQFFPDPKTAAPPLQPMPTAPRKNG